MADIDYRKLTDKQLAAVAAVNGDFSKLSEADFNSINDTLNPGIARQAVNAVDKNVITPINTGINWLGTQFTKGIAGAAGAPRAIGDLNQRIAEWGGEKLGVPETGKVIGSVLRHAVPGFGLTPTAEELNAGIFKTGVAPEVNAGDNPAFKVGSVNLGKMADVGAQAIPFAAAGGGGVLPNFLGGVTSEAAGQATAGTPYELPARILGALPGGWAGTRLTTPLPANLTPQEARAVQIAKETGTPLSVAQETGRGGALERLFARMPGGQGLSERFAARQGAATDRAALKTMGFEGSEVGTETMKAARQQAGGAFDEAIANTPKVELKPDFYNKAGQSIGTYTENVAASEIIPKVANKLDDFMDPKLMKGGAFPELSGQQYQTFRSDLTKSVSALYKSGKAGAADALKGVRDALDDAAVASLPADQAAAWNTARTNYANFKVIEKAAGQGTVASRSSGTLSPSALTSVLRQRQGDAFSRTTGGLNDVASLKQYLADTFPNSGTPTIGAQAMALYNPAMAFAPAAAVNLGQRAMTGGGPVSSVVRNYLANQRMPGTLPFMAGAVPSATVPGFAVEAPNYLRRERRQ